MASGGAVGRGIGESLRDLTSRRAFECLPALLDAVAYALVRPIRRGGHAALAALIVGLPTIGLGAALTAGGRGGLRSDNLAPRRTTTNSLERDRQLVKEHMS